MSESENSDKFFSFYPDKPSLTPEEWREHFYRKLDEAQSMAIETLKRNAQEILRERLLGAFDVIDVGSRLEERLSELKQQSTGQERDLLEYQRRSLEVYAALAILALHATLDKPDLNLFEGACCLVALGLNVGHIQLANPAIMNSFTKRLHSIKSSIGPKSRHAKENKGRAELRAPFDDYIRDRVGAGYKGSAPALVANTLKRKEFQGLREATETKYTEDGKPKNAFIKKRHLEEFVRETIKGNAPL